MCGLAGFWQGTPGSSAELAALARTMAETLAHRGPDDSGTWVDASAGVALVFRRLAILDPSPGGHQPMRSASGRYVIVFNGQVYGFRELRDLLATRGHRFRGSSDTEVILAAVEEWGFSGAVRRLNGMFAIALWDQRERTLSLARDAMGIKPLYYGWAGGVLLFGSELKAIRAHPAFQPEVDRRAVTLYVRHGYVPGPHSIYSGIHKLQPGRLVTFRQPDQRVEPAAYWSLKEVAVEGITHPFRGSEDQALEQLLTLLRDAVRQQMVADVPLGAFLSGGVDSSLIVALMRDGATQPVKTCTMEFGEQGFDEGPYARAVAQALGTDHVALRVTPAEALEVIPRLPEIYDEPLADSAQVPTYLLSRLARQRVTVALSGDGGDEVFCGYTHSPGLQRIWSRYRGVPRRLRQPLGAALAQCGQLMSRLPGAATRQIAGGARAQALALAAADPAGYCVNYLCEGYRFDVLAAEPRAAPYLLTEPGRWPDLPGVVDLSLFFDMALNLPDGMLVKMDRASSAASLEARVPMLDRSVVEFAWRLPLSLKLRGGQGKWILRRLLKRYLPHQIAMRAKHGFSVPISCWLRGPLRDWGEALLDPSRLESDGLVSAPQARHLWQDHLSGRQDWAQPLWRLLMLQAWLRRWA